MIYLSPTAIEEVKRLNTKHLKNTHGFLRLWVEQSGCSGLAYQLKFTATPDPGDQLIESQEIPVAVAISSLPYLEGLTLDYSEDLMGGGFRFHNPQAIKTCGCGNSFAVAGMFPPEAKASCDVGSGI